MDALRTVIVHGTRGCPEENWFPWLASQIRSLGVEAIVPRFPTPDGQNLSNWLSAFRVEAGLLDETTVLVGHSLGVGFILNLLQSSSQRVRATFLIAGFVGRLGLPEFDPLNESFFSRQFDWAKIQANAGRLTLFASDNDPLVPLQKSQELARLLGTPVKLIPKAGHFNTAAGVTTFPELLHDIAEIFNGK